MSDREAGLIKSENNLNIPSYMSTANGKLIVAGIIKFSLRIYCKDGRYKYIITDLTHEKVGNDVAASCSVGPLEKPKEFMCMWNKGWISVKMHANEDIKIIINDLEKTMSGNSKSGTKDNDW